jgi:hypothetical protein
MLIYNVLHPAIGVIGLPRAHDALVQWLKVVGGIYRKKNCFKII